MPGTNAQGLPPTYQGRKQAASRTSDPARLHALALAGQQDGQVGVCKSVAYNEATDAATLTVLGAHPDPTVRYAVAKHANTDRATVQNLLRDAQALVRRGLTWRKDLTAADLDLLGQDQDATVRKGVAWKKECPQGRLLVLANDPHPDVRQVALRHPNLPSERATQAISDSDYGVQRSAVYRGGRAAVTDDFDEEYLLALAKGPLIGRKRVSQMKGTLPESVYRILVRDEDLYVRLNVVDREDCPDWVLRLLAEDAEVDVRVRVAGHGNASAETLTVVAGGRSERAASAVWTRKWTVPLTNGLMEHTHTWMQRHPNPVIRRYAVKFTGGEAAVRLYKARASDPDRNVRVAVAQMQGMRQDGGFLDEVLARDPEVAVRKVIAEKSRQPEVLDLLGNDTSYAVRRLVAANASTSSDTLARLVEDANQGVREAAAKRFLGALTTFSSQNLDSRYATA